MENYKKNEEKLALLNQVMIHHQHWFNNFIGAVICKSHHEIECLLNPELMELETTHKKLHLQALVFQQSFNTSECKKEYDNLIDALEEFYTAIYASQEEIEISIENQPQAMLTPNMITMLPILREQQTFAKRQLQTCYIALLHIDLLNKIQHHYHRNVKDKVLSTVAQLLVEHVRGYDKVFYYSQETFLISLQNVNAEQAFELIDRIRIKISKTPINIGLAEPLFITVSCGITALDPMFTLEQVLQQATITLYLAKTSGRNNIKSWGH